MIRRVRVRGAAGLDPLAARLRVERVLEQAAGSVTLPAEAILCVRRVRDPRPGQVKLRTSQGPPAGWARAVADAVTDLAARAARPARGAVPPDADAVFFDDRAEMLACLAADWCRGSIGTCWWWRTLIGSTADADAVLRAWLKDPIHVAAAVEQVARLGFAAAFVVRLTRHRTATLLDAIVMTHGLDSRLASAGQRDAAADPMNGIPPSARSPASAVRSRPVSGDDPPWRAIAPEAATALLDPEQQQFVGVALTVRRDPARARDAIFVARVVEWREAVASAGPTRSPERPDTAVETVTAASIDAGASLPAPARPSHTATETVMSAAPDGASPSVSSSQNDETAPSVARPTEAIHDVRVPVAPWSSDRHVDTSLGGIFYLLNVALALHLYGDFTSPKAPCLPMSIWRFVALVADALLARRGRRDPVWLLLADLAGPEADFTAASEWRLPQEWLDGLPQPRTWRWSDDGERIRVSHPSRFFIVDVKRSHDRSALQQVREEIEPYRAASSFRLARVRPPRVRRETPLARWTRWHSAYIRARVARALGVTGSGVAAPLVRHRARVHLTSTHVDVAFSLRDLPIAIRLSGLDRDPGWIPAADRVVSFRYD